MDMSGVYAVAGVIVAIFLGIFLLLLFHAWNTRPLPERRNVDTFKVQFPKLTRVQIAAKLQGQFIELGLDTKTGQRAILSGSDRFLHVLNVGRSGIGKTQYFINTFLWRDVGYRDNALFIFDGQGDLTEPTIALCKEYGRSYVVYPNDGYNPLGGSESAVERAERFNDVFAQMAELLSGPGEYYTSRAQTWVRHMVPLFEAVTGKTITLNELQILAADEEKRKDVLQKAGNSKEAGNYILYANWGIAEHDHNVSGLLNFLDRIQAGDRRWQYNQRDAKSLYDVLDAKGVIIVREGGERRSRDRTIGLLFMVTFQNYVKDRAVAKPDANPPDPHPVYAYIDEAHMYFNPNFPTLMATARKKNVALHLGFQNLNQFHPFTDDILGNAGTWLIQGGLIDQDARVIADNIGLRKHVNVSVSYTPGRQEQPNQSHNLEYDYQDGFFPHHIRHLAADKLINIAVEGREVQPARILLKPPRHFLTLEPFVDKPGPFPTPITVWDEELDVAKARLSVVPPTTSVTSADFSDFPETETNMEAEANIATTDPHRAIIEFKPRRTHGRRKELENEVEPLPLPSD